MAWRKEGFPFGIQFIAPFPTLIGTLIHQDNVNQSAPDTTSAVTRNASTRATAVNFIVFILGFVRTLLAPFERSASEAVRVTV